MFRKLKRHLDRERNHYDYFDGPSVRPATPGPPEEVVTVNLEPLVDEQREEFFTWAAKRSGLGLFDGQVEHGYSIDAVSRTDQCPRCSAATERQYSHFIYATQVEPRIMYAAAGHFCSHCPTVIVDEDMIEAGIADPYFHYQGVLGLDVDEQRGQPCLFRTWNGRDAIFVMEEENNMVGLETGYGLSSRAIERQRKLQQKARRKIARKSRKSNRRIGRR